MIFWHYCSGNSNVCAVSVWTEKTQHAWDIRFDHLSVQWNLLAGVLTVRSLWIADESAMRGDLCGRLS